MAEKPQDDPNNPVGSPENPENADPVAAAPVSPPTQAEGASPQTPAETASATPADAEATPPADPAVPPAEAAEMEQSLGEVEDALSAAAAEPESGNSPAEAAQSPETVDDGLIDDATLEELLKQASFEVPGNLGEDAADVGTPVDLPNFSQVIQEAQVSSIDLLRDVDLNVKIELGRSRMLVEDVLKLSEGSVVELDKLAGDPVDVFVNERLVARGEVLVLNDTFCVRINEIVPGVKEEGM